MSEEHGDKIASEYGTVNGIGRLLANWSFAP